MLEQNQDMLHMIWTIFVSWKYLFKNKNGINPNLIFQNISKYKNKIFKQLEA